mgnify:CR=1 FL=1
MGAIFFMFFLVQHSRAYVLSVVQIDCPGVPLFRALCFCFLLARLRMDVCGVLVVLLGSVLFVRSVTTLRNSRARAQVVTLCYPL